MPANITQLIAAGLDRVEFHLLDQNGYAAGNGTVVAGAAGAAALRALGAQSGDLALPDSDIVNIPGDDGSQGTFEFDPEGTPTFNLDVGVQNLVHQGYFQGTNVETQGDISLGVLQPKDRATIDAFLILTSKSKSKASGSDGSSNWTGAIIPKATLRPMGRVAYEGRAGAAFRYRVVTAAADKTPWGKTLTEADNGTEAAPIIEWSAPGRISVHRFTQTSGLTVFGPLAYTPAGATNASMRVFVNGVIQLAGWSASTVTRQITFTPAPPDAAVIVVVYTYTV